MEKCQFAEGCDSPIWGHGYCKKHGGNPLRLYTGVDPVNHPPHYTSDPSGVEVIQITRHQNFNLGNVIKYVLRAPYKDNQIEDLKKARWYLDDEIKRLEATDVNPTQ